MTGRLMKHSSKCSCEGNFLDGEINSNNKNGNALISGRFVCIDTERLHGGREEIREIKWE